MIQLINMFSIVLSFGLWTTEYLTNLPLNQFITELLFFAIVWFVLIKILLWIWGV